MKNSIFRTKPINDLKILILIYLIIAVPTQAAKAPKIDICHFNEGTLTYKKISVSGNALEKHLYDHGDEYPGVDNGEGYISLDNDCQEIIPPAVFARAYINADRIDGFNSDTDVEIARLEDTNNDNTMSIGDTVVFNQYPLSFDPCPAPSYTCTDVGNFNSERHVVTALYVRGDNERVVAVTEGSISFSQWPNQEFFATRYSDSNIRTHTAIRDLIGIRLKETLISSGNLQAGDPSDETELLEQLSVIDDYHIDVDFPTMLP